MPLCCKNETAPSQQGGLFVWRKKSLRSDLHSAAPEKRQLMCNQVTERPIQQYPQTTQSRHTTNYALTSVVTTRE